ncbi:hypothetical protein [Streptomyces sp. NPDC006307]|uniref:hypothetical protein n=1 Tax=Streptomyces sp. NPDC006307 TaxID=3156748 RepID=UPI0033B55597
MNFVSQPPGGSTPNIPVTEQVGRSTKRRAFLGRFAPAYYDLANRHRVRGKDEPNAVLENAVGLMLCYDELWFLRRQDCPADMQELNFVHFVEDDSALLRVATEAYEQARQSIPPIPPNTYEDPVIEEHLGWSSLTVRAKDPDLEIDPVELNVAFMNWALEYGTDWRSRQQRQQQEEQHLQQHIASALERAGHQCVLQPNSLRNGSTFYERVRVDFDQMADWMIADALGLGPMECIVNSGAIMQLAPLSVVTQINGQLVIAENGRIVQAMENGRLVPVTDTSKYFDLYKIAGIEQVLHLRTTDTLGPRGAYHEYIDDLRKDKRVRDLRTFLAGQPSQDGTAEALAARVEGLVADFQEQALLRVHRPAMLRTLASVAVGVAGNKLLPGLGGFLSQMVNLDRTVSDFNFRKNTRWAAFVTDTRRRLRR